MCRGGGVDGDIISHEGVSIASEGDYNLVFISSDKKLISLSWGEFHLALPWECIFIIWSSYPIMFTTNHILT